MRNAVLVAVVGMLLAGCGSFSAAVPGNAPSPAPTPTLTVRHGDKEAPSFRPKPFIVRYAHTQLELEPYTYCWSGDSSGGCADGVDEDPPAIGSPKEIFVFVPTREFSQLVVTLEVLDDGAADHAVEADSRSLGGRWWQVVPPRVPAGTYRVSLFASDDPTSSSGGSGDMVADLLWTIDTER